MSAYRTLKDSKSRKRYDRSLSFQKAGEIITDNLDSLLEFTFTGELGNIKNFRGTEDWEGLEEESRSLTSKIEDIEATLNSTLSLLSSTRLLRILNEARVGTAKISDVKSLHLNDSLTDVDIGVWCSSESLLSNAISSLEQVNKEVTEKGRRLGEAEGENKRLENETKELKVRLNYLMEEKDKAAKEVYELSREVKKVERTQYKETKRVEKLRNLVEKKKSKTLKALWMRVRRKAGAGGEEVEEEEVEKLKEKEEAMRKEVGRLKGRRVGWIRRRSDIDEKISSSNSNGKGR